MAAPRHDRTLRCDDGCVVRFWRLVSLCFGLALLVVAAVSALDIWGIAEVPGAGVLRVVLWPLIFVTVIAWKWWRESASRQHARESRKRYEQVRD